jgi:signal transduction histidine kinase/ligand-binding sensor domain-containing protein
VFIYQKQTVNYVAGLLFIGALSVFSQQQLSFEHITTSQGLSQNSVNCIFQDRNGFLWFGTNEGLNRYDGINFTYFKSHPNDSTTLSGNNITAISEDREGTLWIGTTNGLNSFNPLTGKVKRYILNNSLKNPIHDNYILSVFADTGSGFTNNGKEKVIWVGMWVDGLRKLVIEGKREHIISYQHSSDDSQSLSNNSVQGIYRDPQGRLWIGTNGNSLDEFLPSTNSFSHNYVDSSLDVQCGVRTIFTDSKKRMWAEVYNRGVYQIILEENTHEAQATRARFIPIQIGGKGTNLLLLFPTSIAEDHYGNVWVGYLRFGINKFELNEDGRTTITHFESEQYNPSSLNEMDIRSLCIDNSNILWAGGGFYGINKAQLQKQISLYRHNPSDVHSLPSKSIRAIYEMQDGKLLVGGYAALSLLDRTNNTVTREYAKRHSTGAQQIPPMNIYCIASDPLFSDSILWFGSEDEGLIRYSLSENRYRKYQVNTKDSNALTSNYIFSLYPEKNGNLWIGTMNGLHRVDVRNFKTPKFIFFKHNSENPKSMSTGIVLCIKRASSGILWVATSDGGVNATLPDTPDEFIHFVHNPKDSTSIGSNDVRSICEDKNGRMWFGTLGGGLNLLLPDGKSFKQYLEQDGLPSNFVYGILEDSSGNLWLSTNKGISRFTPSTNEFWNFTPEDGLQDFEFNTGSYYKCNHGEMFFGGINGLNSFIPERITRNAHIPPVHITSVKIFGKEIPFERFLSSTPVLLTHDEDVLTFEFIALDYVSSNSNQYKYKMEGNDDDWVSIGTQRSVSYAHLSPGEYTFRVKGSNNDGVWNEQGASISFVIQPPFWGTWWFQTLGILILLFIGPVIYYRKVRTLLREQALRNEFSQQLIVSQESERKRIANDIHDSVGQNLLVVKNQAYLASKSYSAQPEVKEQFDQIGLITEETLKEIREIARNLRPYQLEQLGLTDTIRAMLRKVKEASSIQFVVELDEIDDAFPKDSHIHLYRIVQETVNNILKHSEADHAFIEIRKEEHVVRLFFRDDGKGFDVLQQERSEGKTRFGLNGIQERVEILGGTMMMTSTPGSETKTEIEIPMKKE